MSDTATRALDQVGVAEGQTLLVSGAAGGVGTAIVQLARLRGITVIATASATKHDYLRELGAVPTTYGEGLEERVRELAPGGVDAAIDVATWVAFRRLMPSPGHGQVKPEQQELTQLRRGVAKLEAERDILKKPWPTLPRS